MCFVQSPIHPGLSTEKLYKKIFPGKLVSLSEEQLVECVKRDYGCGGGWPLHAFSYWQHAGSVSEADYPYTDETKWLQEVGTCKAYGLPITATVAGVVHLPSGSEASNVVSSALSKNLQAL